MPVCRTGVLRLFVPYELTVFKVTFASTCCHIVSYQATKLCFHKKSTEKVRNVDEYYLEAVFRDTATGPFDLKPQYKTAWRSVSPMSL